MVPKRNVEVHNEITDALPVPELDREQFRQIVINLAQNAIEAIPSDRTGRVTVRAESRDGGALRLVIEDNGSGVTDHVAQKMFEPLFTAKVKGTGLGLAVVSTVVKRHVGKITVESELGRWTRILIDVPPVGAVTHPMPSTSSAKEMLPSLQIQ